MCREELIDFSHYDVRKDGTVILKKKNKEMSCNTKSIGGYIANGYFTKDGRRMPFYRHRVIWYYFNGEIPNGYELDHINGDKTDNSLSNLRCVTRKENVNNPITRQKMLDEVWSNEERNRKIGEANKGKIPSQEQREKQSKAMSGSNHPNFGKKRPAHSRLMSTRKRDTLGRWIKV